MICNYFSCRASYGQPRQTYAINIPAPPLFLALCVCVCVPLVEENAVRTLAWTRGSTHCMFFAIISLFSISSRPVGKRVELAVIRSVKKCSKLHLFWSHLPASTFHCFSSSSGRSHQPGDCQRTSSLFGSFCRQRWRCDRVPQPWLQWWEVPQLRSIDQWSIQVSRTTGP